MANKKRVSKKTKRAPKALEPKKAAPKKAKAKLAAPKKEAPKKAPKRVDGMYKAPEARGEYYVLLTLKGYRVVAPNGLFSTGELGEGECKNLAQAFNLASGIHPKHAVRPEEVKSKKELDDERVK